MNRALLLLVPRTLRGMTRSSFQWGYNVRPMSTTTNRKLSNLKRWGRVCVNNCAASVDYDAPGLTASSLKMTAADVACAVKYITHGTYERLGSYVIGWRGDPWAGYTQIRGWQRHNNEQYTAAMAPLLSDPSMQRLLNLVEENIHGFTAKEAVETLFSLLLIGHHTAPVIGSLLSHSKQHTDGMDIKCLMLLARISDLFQRDDFALIHLVLRRYKLLLELKFPRNDSTVNAFCVFTQMLYKYISPSLLEKFYEYLLSVVTFDMPLHLYSIDTLVNISLVSLNGTASTQKQIVSVLKKQLPGRISEFKPYHLMRISTAMQSQSLYDDTTRKLIDSQVCKMIKQNEDGYSLGETLMFFRALVNNSDHKLVQKVESLIEKKLKKDDMDCRLTVQLARSLYKVDSSNLDLVGRVQSKVAEYPVSVNLQMSSFVTLKQFIDSGHKEALVEKLLQAIEGGEPYTSGEHLKSRCVYMLALMLPLLPESNTRLLPLIATWTFKELSLFLYGLMKWPYQEFLIDRRRKGQEKHVHEISGIFEMVMENVIAKADASKTLSFFITILATSNMKWTEKMYYTQELMGKFHADAKSIIANSNQRSLCHILKYCATSRYFDSEICDALSETTIDANRTELRYSTLHYLFAYLGIIGYRPKNVENMMPHARWFLSEVYKANSLHHYLRTMANLVEIGSVPVDRLAAVFTTDFLAKLNEFLKDNPDQQISTYEHLAFLNQAAVLDFPHLSVPWFLDDVVKKMVKVPNQSAYIWESVLRQLLGGSEYYQKFTWSPVGHYIDFELLTDHSNTVQKSDSQLVNGRRIAIVIEPEHYYCTVVPGAPFRRLGKRQRHINHLQKLGYSVLDLPGHEWPHRKSDYERYLRHKLRSAKVKVKDDLRTSFTHQASHIG